MSGSVRMASTASLSPCTTFKAPGGAPASSISSARRSEHDGSFSDGFKMKVLPQAMAIGNIHIGTMAGKLNGVMPAQTPIGWRVESPSTPVPTLAVKSPFRRFGMPVTNSTISMPRWTELLASDSVLPCSHEISSASSSMWRSHSSLKRNMTRARKIGVVDDHPGSAASAASTALRTSAPLANGTFLVHSPVAGLKTSPKRPLSPATFWPLMWKCRVSVIDVLPAAAPPAKIASLNLA